MQNTNCGDNCCFVKSGFCNTDRECPFYCESIWQVDGGKEIKTIKDCHPKRSTMETNNLNFRMMVVQQIQEDLRNRLDRIEFVLNTLVQQSQSFLQECEDQLYLKEKLQFSHDKNIKKIE